MSLECGIVGLPNVGKSTLFNTLTSASVAAENFPFCTVDPNKGLVKVPDFRLDQLVEIVKPKSRVPTNVSFVDIAGLVKGASAGEGLGNQFLSHIRSVDAIAHVVRCFADDNVTHVMGRVDPIDDVGIIDLELCLADADQAARKVEKLQKIAKSGNNEAKQELAQWQSIHEKLSEGIPLRQFVSEFPELNTSEFITSKPLLYVANLHEEEVAEQTEQTQQWLTKLKEKADAEGAQMVQLSASLEYQISQLETAEEKQEFMKEYGLQSSGLEQLIRKAYELLGLITFFTAGEKEVRAWTIQKGQNAQEAAGKIHTDFARGFIRAEVIHFKDFVEQNGEKAAKEKGLQRSEGKEYIVQDADIMLFRFNV